MSLLAAGYGGADGRNRLGETIFIAGDSYYDLYVIKGPSERDWSRKLNASSKLFAAAGFLFSNPVSQKSALLRDVVGFKLYNENSPKKIETKIAKLFTKEFFIKFNELFV